MTDIHAEPTDHGPEWKGKWVVADHVRTSTRGAGPAVHFRRSVPISGRITHARLYATCHGVYRLAVNGHRADDRELAPEFTVYEKYLCYQTYDVTGLLREGENVVGLTVADGWYRGATTKQTYPGFDPRPAVLWQLEVTHEDGTTAVTGSDGAVRATTGAVTSSDLMRGEVYDARLERQGWDEPGYDDADWPTATVADFGFDNLMAQDGEPVRSTMALPVSGLIQTPDGDSVLDVGQNIAGRLRVRLDLPEGTRIQFEHSETLDEHGRWFNNIQGISQRDVFVSAGRPTVFEPAFTFHGFRYVRVTGGDVEVNAVTAVVLSTDAEWVGTFECSDARLNRLVENTRWSQRSNMVSIPTDCPQREKMGWTGDMTVYAVTALQHQDLTGLLTRWLSNLALAQQPDGQVPNVVPQPDFFRRVAALTNLLLGASRGNITGAGWGDAAVIVPWSLYAATGDPAVLESQYESMKAWVEYQRTEAAARSPRKGPQPPDVEKYLWNTGFQFGEWLIPSATKHGSLSAAVRRSAKAGRRYIAPAFAYLSASRLAQAARVIGRDADADTYADLAAHMKAAYQAALVNPDGTLGVDVQGAYAIALGLNLIPDALRAAAAARLAKLIHANGDRLDTGFLATGYLLDALFENGQAELAWSLLFQEESPSWLYAVAHGATTIWENWNAVDDRGAAKKVSLNHYAFGVVADWIHRRIGGITAHDPGYKNVVIAPAVDRRLTWARRSHRSPQGLIAVGWQRAHGRFHIQVTIPPATTATVILPDGVTHEVGHGDHAFECADPVEGPAAK